MAQISKTTVRVNVQNIGGIGEASVTLPDGVSILAGRNATNRTSFLQALMAGLGSRQSSLKGDAEEGEVTLEFGDETYTRTLQRCGNSVTFGGDPYLDDPELADLFAFLLENNEARRAVARGDDLREIIMRPIDTDSIDAEIRECKRERDDLESEIEKLDSLERDLPDLEADRREKVAELESAQEELEAVREELGELDTGVEESRTRKEEMEEAFQRVRDARSELDDLEFDLETERSTLSELKAEREELQETIEEAMGCPIRSSMVVEEVGTDDLGRPVYAAVNALDADAVLLANRVKVHTDFCGDVESGLSKIAVVGLGKHRGAESLHNAAIAADFTDVIEDRMDVLLAETSIVGGITLVENANDRAAHIEGINSAAIPNREPELLDLAREEFSDLPVDDLDMLVVDEAGKDKSGTGMDTNVLGRYYFHGETEPKTPNVTRVYVRSLTGPSHGNALGVGLADFVHQQFVADIDFEDTYVNIATSGETRRAKIPFVVPDDETALLLACSTTGVSDPDALRIARIPSTMEPNRLVISEPVATELRERDDFEVGLSRSLAFEDGMLPEDPY